MTKNISPRLPQNNGPLTLALSHAGERGFNEGKIGSEMLEKIAENQEKKQGVFAYTKDFRYY
ncbi:MAG: hypothetical protein NT056_07105 [Proteobacteria bacterium]|nr:hypothetical protein [Pseudomonadota bacterium]